MFQNKYLIILPALLFSALSFSGQKVSDYSERLKGVSKEYKVENERLQEEYKAIILLLETEKIPYVKSNETRITALKNSQSAWINFRDLECELQGLIPNEGEISEDSRVMCFSEQATLRTQMLIQLKQQIIEMQVEDF